MFNYRFHLFPFGSIFFNFFGGRATVGKYTNMYKKTYFWKEIIEKWRFEFFLEMADINLFRSIRWKTQNHQIPTVFKENFTFPEFLRFFKSSVKIFFDHMFKITQKNYQRCPKLIFQHFSNKSKIFFWKSNNSFFMYLLHVVGRTF